ncbi:mechanosensitive ion channel family protein [Actinoplanes derwentensis]|uniref:Conserved TM helix n=1 Tax=Actinoplanes derwentensis TaxID=113562 RepID=A0A1H2D9E4_9ACTN|nr:hypothetical protein [Actinoplanes derwentensis]GID81582.1 hypothetical protein Ade03nite_05060 [Actinoplanes derwentensis]SDT79360.1 Conserved TM helix [Actinoplanes derwentensis]
MTGDGLSRGLSDMWRSVVLSLPSVGAFLAILVAGYLLARLARTVTARTLRRLGFDRAVQRGPAGRLFRPGVPDPTDVCARLAFFAVLLISLQLAFGVWGPNPASDLLNVLIAWLPRLFVAIVVVVVAAALAGAAHDLILAVLGPLEYARVLAKAAAGVIVTLGVIAGLDQIGIATSVTRPLLIAVLATVAGVIVVGVGGGLVRPMQQRWEGWLDRAAAESAVIREQARAHRSTPPDPVPAPAPDPGGPDSPEPPGGRLTVPMPPAAPTSPPSPGAEPSPAAAKSAGADDVTVAQDWEKRWAEEERRTREPDDERTQVISPLGTAVLTPGVRPTPTPPPPDPASSSDGDGDDDPTVPTRLPGDADEEPTTFLTGHPESDDTTVVYERPKEQ